MFKNVRKTLARLDGANTVTLISSPLDSALIVKELQMFSSLSTPPVVSPGQATNQYIDVLFIDLAEGKQYPLSLVPFFRRSQNSTIDLLSCITLRDSFTLAPNTALAVRLAAGTNFLGEGDFLSFYGSACTPDELDTKGVSQTFVTAQYSVPAREQIQNAAYLSNWQSANGAAAQFYKDQIGRVHLMGFAARVQAGVSQPQVFLLPESYRPVSFNQYVCWNSGVPAQIDLYPDGYVRCSVTNTNPVSLGGISFLSL